MGTSQYILASGRRRIGRGGRVIYDRKIPRSYMQTSASEYQSWKFDDQDSGGEGTDPLDNTA